MHACFFAWNRSSSSIIKRTNFAANQSGDSHRLGLRKLVVVHDLILTGFANDLHFYVILVKFDRIVACDHEEILPNFPIETSFSRFIRGLTETLREDVNEILPVDLVARGTLDVVEDDAPLFPMIVVTDDNFVTLDVIVLKTSTIITIARHERELRLVEGFEDFGDFLDQFL